MDQDVLIEQLTSVVAKLSATAQGLEKAVRDHNENILVSGNEAARLLDCSPTTICKYIKEGRLERVTIGCSSGIRLSQIVEFKAL